MGTLKQRVIEWVESLSEDCTLGDVQSRLEAFLRYEQEQGEREPAFACRGERPAKLEVVCQELARQGFNGKAAALQAYLSRRGQTG